MPQPKTADERERRFVQYISELNKGQLAEIRLMRMNRIANFRKALLELVNKMVEERAEDLAAAMLMEHAPERPRRGPVAVERRKLPGRKAAVPPWIREESKALAGKRSDRAHAD
jgi:hypothetical protein